MQFRELRVVWFLGIAVIAMVLVLSSHAWSETKCKILHGFTGRDGDGGGLWGSLAVDA